MSLWFSLLLLPGLVIGLSLHEFAHAWSASLLGDDYPRRQGRVSLNPFRHLSLWGTLALFVLPFGWARPVSVNLYHFKHPRRDFLWTSLAGPAANVLVLAACIAVMYLTRHTWRYGHQMGLLLGVAFSGAYLTALINAILAAFNLLPVPPLDGSKIWPCLLPGLKPVFAGKATWLWIAVLVVGMQSGWFEPVVGSVIGGATALMPRSDDALGEELADKGASAHESEQYQDAERLFTEALALTPYNDEVHYRRGVERTFLGDLPGALEDFSRAIELNPSQADYYDARAAQWDALGRGDAAQVDRASAEALRDTAAGDSRPEE